MTLTNIINIVVLLLPILVGYATYVIQKKVKLIDDIVFRMYSIEKHQAVTDNKIENIKENK